MMRQRSMCSAIAIALCLAATGQPSPARAARTERFSPGAPGVGDPYFPLDGNGGFDVEHYWLALRYDPELDDLRGVATIRARATQNLSSFNLDLDGLEVSSVVVNGSTAAWSHEDGELRIAAERGLPDGMAFEVAIAYGGVPRPDEGGASGFVHTEDGAVVAGQPHVAATWFPANDHPSDTAAFTFEVTVPEGLEVVANGALADQRTSEGWTTWRWEASAPMATYLAGMSIGDLDIRAYEHAGVRYWDAIPTRYLERVAPPAGDRFLISQLASESYERVTRVISVPPEGARLSFWVTRDTNPGWEFFFVEAHTVGSEDWTTLPDMNGATTREPPGLVLASLLQAPPDLGCRWTLDRHAFLEHYVTLPSSEGEPCTATGDTGDWWAATRKSRGAERWLVDLGAYAGSSVEIALTYASDAAGVQRGVFLDDIQVSSGPGSTSFEADGDVMDGWIVAGPPEGHPENTHDWIVGTAADAPPVLGDTVRATLARQPEIIAFLEQLLGPYPFDIAGASVHDSRIGFGLEQQTRPVYPVDALLDPSDPGLIVHELAHQWLGDSVSLASWQHIWLNEGFATYAGLLWDEHVGRGRVQDWADGVLALDASDPLWSDITGDPGPGLFAGVYARGALTLHQLRLTVGDDLFFEILRTWTCSRAGTSVTTDDFIALAEAISGQDLRELFEAWLFTPAKPAMIVGPSPGGSSP